MILIMTDKILLPWYLPGKIKEGEGQDIEEATKRFGIGNGVPSGVRTAEREKDAEKRKETNKKTERI